MQDHQKQRSSMRNRKMFPCHECDLIFKTTREVEDHIQNDHQCMLEESNFVVDSTIKAKKSQPSTSQLKEKIIQASKSVNKSFKANSSRDITVVNESFVCECGFTSLSKSGTSRHKCHKDKLLLKCSYCEKHSTILVNNLASNYIVRNQNVYDHVIQPIRNPPLTQPPVKVYFPILNTSYQTCK